MSGTSSARLLLAFAASILFLLLPGCRNQQEVGSSPVDVHQGRELVIGISPELNLFRQRERFEPLADYLSHKLGMKIELKLAGSYHDLLEMIQAKELDAAFLGSFAGAVAIRKFHAEPVARMEYVDGTSTYRGLLFARKDSNIITVQDMKGKTLVLVDRATTAGWLHPLKYFKEQGVSDPFSWMGEVYFAGTHEDAILDVVNNRADVGAAKDTIYSHLAQSDKRLAQLRILATSPPVPANTLMFCRETDEALRRRVQQALLAMHEDSEGKTVLAQLDLSKFIETSERDYDVVFTYAESIGIDITHHRKEDHAVEKRE